MDQVVLDTDRVFRGLPRGSRGLYEWREGQPVVKQSAFNDRHRRPSVDLARLCPNEEPRAELHPENGCLVLDVGEVRHRCSPVSKTDSKGRLVGEYLVDVRHRPERDNRAHCQIEAQPDFDTAGQFKKLKHLLARVARWHVPPPRESSPP